MEDYISLHPSRIATKSRVKIPIPAFSTEEVGAEAARLRDTLSGSPYGDPGISELAYGLIASYSLTLGWFLDRITEVTKDSRN